jgi:hypothetical protein
MQALSHQPALPSAPPVEPEVNCTPFSMQTVTVNKAEYIQTKWEAKYYRATI